MYAARVMDGESVPIWLNFGVGKGLLCSPRLSWVSCFAAARLILGRRAGRSSPSRCMPTERQGCPAKATIPWPEAGGALVLHLATEINSDSAKQVHGHFQEKEQGVPTSLCYKGQVPTSVR